MSARAYIFRLVTETDSETVEAPNAEAAQRDFNDRRAQLLQEGKPLGSRLVEVQKIGVVT